MRTLSRRRGYTLTELMMVVAITGILFAAGPPLLIQVQNFYLMTNARQSIERDARVSLDTINRFLRQAQAGTIDISTPPASSPSSKCGKGGGIYSRISFTLMDGREVSFWQSGSYLCESIWVSPTNSTLNQTVLTENLGYIAFATPQTDAPTIVSVSITMSKAIQLGRKKVLELTIQKVRVMNS